MSDFYNSCAYCTQFIKSPDDFLICELCKSNVHVRCLKRPGTPGDLLGDVFFTFTCCSCALDHKEAFSRQKLPWMVVLALALYNLSIKSKGLSRHGYFHWRSHIVNFIDKYWDFIFDPSTRRKKKWTGTVSGALSHNSPEFFVSGQELFQETGWWKLAINQKPKYFLNLYEEISAKRQQMRADKKLIEENNYSSDFSTNPTEDTRRTRVEHEEEPESCSRTLPYMGRNPKRLKRHELVTVPLTPKVQGEDDEDFNTVQSSLMDFLAESLVSNELLFNEHIPISKDLPSASKCDIFDNALVFEEDFICAKPFSIAEVPTPAMIKAKQKPEVLEDVLPPRIVQVTNFQQTKFKNIKNTCSIVKEDKKSSAESASEDSAEEEASVQEVAERSLFTKADNKRPYPWLHEETEEHLDNQLGEECSDKDIVLLSEYEEKEMYQKLRKINGLKDKYKLQVPTNIYRFYRKLAVRDLKRSFSRKFFNIDSFGEVSYTIDGTPHILDRYHLLSGFNENNMHASFLARMVGTSDHELFESPFSSRVLHPFIYRNADSFPIWLKLMCEVQFAVTDVLPTRSTIDFCYVRPHHIGAVNALLQTVFWPGIDMSECLSYPDFSVVALYKKLVVGCAFLVPDVGFNEAYISFMAVRSGWQREGIASFMLYHLIQTCMSKDITLHVSATNPAVCLYQKFGFKIEEVILDFYEKYLPFDSKHSRHAFFLRLKR